MHLLVVKRSKEHRVRLHWTVAAMWIAACWGCGSAPSSGSGVEGWGEEGEQLSSKGRKILDRVLLTACDPERNAVRLEAFSRPSCVEREAAATLSEGGPGARVEPDPTDDCGATAVVMVDRGVIESAGALAVPGPSAMKVTDCEASFAVLGVWSRRKDGSFEQRGLYGAVGVALEANDTGTSSFCQMANVEGIADGVFGNPNASYGGLMFYLRLAADPESEEIRLQIAAGMECESYPLSLGVHSPIEPYEVGENAE